MYVKKGNEKPFFIAVFDLTQFDNFDLDTYVKTQKIQYLKDLAQRLL